MSMHQSRSPTEQSEKNKQRSWTDFLRENQQQRQQQQIQERQLSQPVPGSLPGYVINDQPRLSQPPIPQPQPRSQPQEQRQQSQEESQPTQRQQTEQQRTRPDSSRITASPRINDERPLPLSDKEHVREFEVNGRRIRVYFVVPRLDDARTQLERKGQSLTNMASDFQSQVDSTSYLRGSEFSTWLSIRTRRPNIYGQNSNRRDIADVLEEAIRQYDFSSLEQGTYEVYIHDFTGSPRGNLNTIDSILSGTLYLTRMGERNQETSQLLRIPNATQNFALRNLRAEAQVLIDQEIREVYRQIHYSRDSIQLSQRIERNSLVYPVDLTSEPNAVTNPIGDRTDRQEFDLRLGRRDYGIRFSQDRSTYYTNFGNIGKREAQPGESERSARELEFSRFGETTYARVSEDRTEQIYRDRYDYLAGPDPRTLAYSFGIGSLRDYGNFTPLTQVRQGNDTRFDIIDQSFSPSEFRTQLSERLDAIRGPLINALTDLYMERIVDTKNMTTEQVEQERQRATERFRSVMSDDSSIIRLLTGNVDYMSRGFGANFGRINEGEFYRLFPEFQGRNITPFDVEERFSRISGSNLRVITRDLNSYYYAGIRRLSGEILGTTGLYYDIWSRDQKGNFDNNLEGRLFYHRDVSRGIRRATAQYFDQGRFQEYSFVTSLGQKHEVAGAYVQNDQNRASVAYGIDKDKLRIQRQGIHPYMVGAMNRDVDIAGERSNTTLGFLGARVRLGNPQSLGSFYGTAIAGVGSNNSYLFSYRADDGSKGVVREATIYKFDKEQGDAVRLAAITRDEKSDEEKGTYSLRERTYDAYTYGYRNPRVDFRQTGIGFTERHQRTESDKTSTRDLYVRAFNTRNNNDSSTTVSGGVFSSSYNNGPEVQDVQTPKGNYIISTSSGNYTGITASASFYKSKEQSTSITLQHGERKAITISDSQGTYSMNTDPLRASIRVAHDNTATYVGGDVEWRTRPTVHVGKEGGTTTSVSFFGLRGATDGKRSDVVIRCGVEERRVGGYSAVQGEYGQQYGRSYYSFSYEFGRVTPSVSSSIAFGVNSISGINLRFSVRF